MQGPAKMPDFELHEEIMNIRIRGESFEVRHPSCEEQEAFEEQFALVKDDLQSSKPMMELMRKYLSVLGLPEEVSKKLPMGQFMRLVGFINTPKKN